MSSGWINWLLIRLFDYRVSYRRLVGDSDAELARVVLR